MAAIEVATFRLRCAAAQRESARFAIEDALRTELPDDGRLVLLRRLAVSAPGSSRQVGKRQAAMREAWVQATGGARHGGEDGAGQANCVWFASREEAERLLLARLLAGRAVDAWFWKLALPDWRGAPVGSWLAETLAEAIARHEDARVLALVETCVAQGAVERLMTALAADESLPAAVLLTPWTLSEPARATEDDPRERVVEDIARQAATLLTALPVRLRDLLVRLDRAGTRARPAIAAVLRAFAMRRSPALALNRAMLESTVAEAVRLIDTPPTLRPRAGGDLRQPKATPRSDARGPRLHGKAEASVRDNAPGARPIAPQPQGTSEEAPAPAAEAREPLPEPAAFEGLRSHHTGLWLVLPSLVALGFGEWLAERPDLLAAHPARQLLLAVARHHRVPFDDPALAVLTPDPDEALPAWTALWRHGLDRWLRRHARRRVHDLVRRPGTLAWGDLRLDLRFPMADADIRLRRLALDRDPGWVPWLGLSVRYHFSEELRA